MNFSSAKLFFSALVRAFLLSALVAAFLTSAGASTTQATKKDPQESIIIDSTVTLLLAPDEPQPLEAAAEDLQSDFAKVLGNKPQIVHSADAAGPVTVWIGEISKLPESLRPVGLSKPESFSISAAQGQLKSHAGRIVILAGADLRGTIYAIYQFSEEYLGVDPLYYWTDHEPPRRARIELLASLNRQFPAPVFKYRGFFINDEDLKTGAGNCLLSDASSSIRAR